MPKRSRHLRRRIDRIISLPRDDIVNDREERPPHLQVKKPRKVFLHEAEPDVREQEERRNDREDRDHDHGDRDIEKVDELLGDRAKHGIIPFRLLLSARGGIGFDRRRCICPRRIVHHRIHRRVHKDRLLGDLLS